MVTILFHHPHPISASYLTPANTPGYYPTHPPILTFLVHGAFPLPFVRFPVPDYTRIFTPHPSLRVLLVSS